MHTLRELYEQHQGKVSDKWSIYLSEYERHFSGYRERPVRLLEIGIQNGGSLELWGKYFPHAQRIVGCDINLDCAGLHYADSRISVVVGDANSNEVEARIAATSPQFDLILDDGSHRSSDILRAFARYFRRLADGGLFVVEDMHCSYWQAFEGGLFDPASSMSFFKRLADVIGHEHWGIAKARKDVLETFARKYAFDIDEELLGHVHSIEFANSLCLIRKEAPAANVLGERVIAGTDEAIVSGHLGLNHSGLAATDETLNPWSVRAPEDELTVVKTVLSRLQADAELRDEHQRREIAALRSSLEASFSGAERLRERLRIAESQLPRFRVALELLQQQRIAVEAQPAESLQQQPAERPNSLQQALASTSRRIMKPVQWLQGKNRARLAARRRRTAAKAAAGNLPAIGAATRREVAPRANDYVAWLSRYDVVDDDLRSRMRRRIEVMGGSPLISVVMPTYNANPAWLREAIESVRGQIYTKWELCIADDSSTSTEARELLKSYADSDARIKVVFRGDNGHISAASNSALELAVGDWVALMDHDDLLPEHALFWIADAIVKHPEVQLIYSDEDKVDESGVRSGPYFKPDWNVDLFYAQNMFSHLGVYKTELVRKVGGFRVGMEGSQDYDLVLRCLEHVSAAQIQHVPKVLYQWRVHPQSTAHSTKAKPYAQAAGERALNEHFSRRGIAGSVEHIGVGYRAHYALPAIRPLVSLVLITRNAAESVRRCVESILTRTTYDPYEILIADNGSDDSQLLHYLHTMQDAGALRIVDTDAHGSHAKLSNMAVAQARGEVVGLISHDIEAIAPAWLAEMVSIALQPEVGAVGARLWSSNKKLQHGGMVLGLGGIAGHAQSGLAADDHGYFGRAALIQSFSAVTGACLLVKKERYEAVGGLNEVDPTEAFGDVDFCLRLREAGLRNVFTPYAELLHHAPAASGIDLAAREQACSDAEVAFMTRRWGDLLQFDPAYSPNLTLAAADFSYAWPPRDRADMDID